MWPPMHYRGKGPPCPGVFILKQQGWWQRWKPWYSWRGKARGNAVSMYTWGTTEPDHGVTSIYPNSPGDLFFTPTCFLTFVSQKLTQEKPCKDFPYTQPLTQELSTFVHFVSSTYPLFFFPPLRYFKINFIYHVFALLSISRSCPSQDC